MSKSEVYSWRLSPELKARLQRRARQEGVSLSTLLERLSERWLRDASQDDERDDAEQARLRQAVSDCVGSISGGQPSRAENARALVRARLHEKHDAR